MGLAKRKSSQRWDCAIEGCDREAQISDLCHPCYAADLYWAKKTVGQRRKRMKQLGIFATRMEQFVPKLRSVK